MNQYDIQKVVGQGSYGRAILCKRKKDSKLCIIKQISLAKLSKREAKMTEQEALLLGRLQHPNIVQFWESFVNNSNLHIVMEFADGGDLDNYIKNYIKSSRGREMPEAQVLNLFVQICLAIKHIHDRKILHRDLKGQNVFLTSSGLCKVGDFGVSRVLRSTVELASTQIGTPYYMSPEIMNNQKYNSKTDIWSLGIILYELVCLRLPFQGNSMKQLCYNIINATPASPSGVYSKEMRELVRDILAKDPRKRPSVNNILSRSLIKGRIQNFLNETKLHKEFSHTILHGAHILNNPAPQQPVAVPPSPQVKAAMPLPAQPQPQPVNNIKPAQYPNPQPVNVKPVQNPSAVQQPAVQQQNPSPIPQPRYMPAPRNEPKSVHDLIKNLLRPAQLKQEHIAQQQQAVVQNRPPSANAKPPFQKPPHVMNPAPPSQIPVKEVPKPAPQVVPPAANIAVPVSQFQKPAVPIQAQNKDVPKQAPFVNPSYPSQVQKQEAPKVNTPSPIPNRDVPIRDVPKPAIPISAAVHASNKEIPKAVVQNPPIVQKDREPVKINAQPSVPIIPVRDVPRPVPQQSPRIPPKESPRVINIPAQPVVKDQAKPKEENLRVVGAGVPPQLIAQRSEKKIEVIPKPNMVVKESPRLNNEAAVKVAKDVPQQIPKSQVPLSRDNSSNNIKSDNKPPANVAPLYSNVYMKKREADSGNSTPQSNASDRMKAIDAVLGKAAAVLDVINQEKQKAKDRYEKNPSPVVVEEKQAPVVVSKQPASAKPVAGEPWLANLQDQMGALKVQMQQMQANKMVSNAPPSVEVPSKPAPVTPKSDIVESNIVKVPASQPQQKAIGRSASEKANVRASRQSFPVSKNDLPNPALAKMKKNVAQMNEKYNSPKVPGVNLNKPNANNKKPSDAVQMKAKAAAAAAIKPKEQLEQRKEMREKHRMGFKQFLQAQRQGHAQTPGSMADDSSAVNMADDFTEASHEGGAFAFPKSNPRDNAFITELQSSSHISKSVESLHADSHLEGPSIVSEPSSVVSSSKDDKKQQRERERMEFRKLIYEKRQQQAQQQETPRKEMIKIVSGDISIVAPAGQSSIPPYPSHIYEEMKSDAVHSSAVPNSARKVATTQSQPPPETNEKLFQKSTGKNSIAAALQKEQLKKQNSQPQKESAVSVQEKQNNNNNNNARGKQESVPPKSLDTLSPIPNYDIMTPEDAACCTMWGSYFRSNFNAKIIPQELDSEFTPMKKHGKETMQCDTAVSAAADNTESDGVGGVSFNEESALAPFESEEVIHYAGAHFPDAEESDEQLLLVDPLQSAYDELANEVSQESVPTHYEPSSTIGNSVVVQWHADPSMKIIDDDTAMEYSLMLQQMQEILELPSRQHHHSQKTMDRYDAATQLANAIHQAGVADLDVHDGDGEDEEIEEGFEEESISFCLSDTDDVEEEELQQQQEEEEDVPGGAFLDEEEDELRVVPPKRHSDSSKEHSLMYTRTVGRHATKQHGSMEEVEGDDDAQVTPRMSRDLVVQKSRRHSDSALLSYHARHVHAQEEETEEEEDRSNDQLTPIVNAGTSKTMFQQRTPVYPPTESTPTAAATAATAAGGEAEEEDDDAESIRINAFDETMGSMQLIEGDGSVVAVVAASHDIPPMQDDFQLMKILQEKLIETLGVPKYSEGMEFLHSAFLVDEGVDDEQLLTMLEQIIGEDNLAYLEDMYQLFTLQQMYAST